jgi:hypothetical protein
MWTQADARAADDTKLLATRDADVASSSHVWLKYAEMAIHADETGVLHDQLQPAEAAPLHSQKNPGGSRTHWRAVRRGQINSVVVSPRLRMIG